MRRLVLHHDDLDGSAAAAVVLYLVDPKAICTPINYNQEFPLDVVKRDDEVWVVDYSLKKHEWAALRGKVDDWRSIIFIDHHKTAIESQEGDGVLNLNGIRTTGQGAGCLLTWDYACGYVEVEREAPMALLYVSDRDEWKFEYGDETRDFFDGVQAVCDTRPGSSFWPTVFDKDTGDAWCREYMRIGRMVGNKRRITNAEDVKMYSFQVGFEGYKAISLNKRGCGSDAFATVANEYDLLMPCWFDGKQWTVSIYRGGTLVGQEIDCSALAKEYGGGGHAGAAGFQCSILPWEY